MSSEIRSSAGQKRRTPLIPSLHTSYFFKQEAKHLIAKGENRFKLGLFTLMRCSVLSLAFTVCACAYRFHRRLGISTLEDNAEKLLLFTFFACVSFICLFLYRALFCGAVLFAYKQERQNDPHTTALSYIESKDAFSSAFGEYLLFIIANAIIFVFPSMCIALYRTNEKFDAITVIIYAIFILTYLYLLCIINGITAVLPCINGKKRISSAIMLLKGHICEFIFLNIRLLPSLMLSVLSLGVLHLTHTAPMICASYACFVSYAEDVGAYSKLLPKGIDTNER